MFTGTYNFNQPLNDWNVSSATTMFNMFSYSGFNQNLNSWNTSNVTIMQEMFMGNSTFNGEISNWNTSNVLTMGRMFMGAGAFNQPIGNWNTQNVANMFSMFYNATSFNQPLLWSTNNVTDFTEMFGNATAFNQDLGNLNISNLVWAERMFANSGLSCENYSATLNGWANSGNAVDGVNFLAQTGMEYNTSAENSRNHLVTAKNWAIDGDTNVGANCASTNSIDELQVAIDVYPNPSTNSISITATKPSSLRICNSLGAVIQNIEIIDNITLDISNLDTGVYFIDSNALNSVRFIKL